MAADTNIEVESIYGVETRRGLVRLTMGDRTLHMAVAKAREIGTWLLEAATAAESDAAFMALLAETEMRLEERTQMLGRFRTIRIEVQQAEAELNGESRGRGRLEDESDERGP